MFSTKHTLIFIVCFLLFAANSLSAKTDTLSYIGDKPKKGDSTQYLDIFRKFNWDVNIKNKSGKTRQYFTQRPDSLFDSNDLDTVLLSTSLFVDPRLLNKIVALRYHLEGSLLFQLNGKTVLATGVFSGDRSKNQGLLFQNDFKDFIFTDSLQKLDITYLPYPKTGIFFLNLRIYPISLAEEKRQEIINDVTDDNGFGFYYLAFGIVFLSLFVFFKGRTEHLYFSMFCIFAALSFISNTIKTDIFYNLGGFFDIFCFEFLSIFFYKVLKEKEKSKIPLMVIAFIMAVCLLPAIRYNYVSLFGKPVAGILTIVYLMLYGYTLLSSFYFLVIGIWQKRWEARAILIICFIPIVLFILFFICFVIAAAVTGATANNNKLFSLLIGYLTSSIIYIYPLAAVYILGRRNGINQKQLIAQVLSIRQLSEDNLAKEKEKQQILEDQKGSLEQEVSLRTAEIVMQKEEIEKQHGDLKIEKKKSDDLLHNILPAEVAEELKEKGFSEAKLFDNVTVLFADFVDFTKAGEAMTAQELVNELHTCFKTFDEIISRYNIEKIKTIGDAYLAVCGLPAAHADHAQNVVSASLDIIAFMQQRQKLMGDKTFRVRIGIHSGSVVAGIVGVKKFAYDIWGDTVNTAARMEQCSEPGRINMSQATYELVKDKFNIEYRGEIDAKNKGMLKMYFIV